VPQDSPPDQAGEDRCGSDGQQGAQRDAGALDRAEEERLVGGRADGHGPDGQAAQQPGQVPPTAAQQRQHRDQYDRSASEPESAEGSGRGWRWSES
jgi:hypothetical protein